jgi:hypothetical protein
VQPPEPEEIRRAVKALGLGMALGLLMALVARRRG